MKTLILILMNLYSLQLTAGDITLESVKTINGNSGVSDYCFDAAASIDGGMLTVGNSSDGITSYAILTKFNSSGQTEWIKTYRDRINGTNSYTKISTDATGNIYVVGGILDDISNYDILIQKYTPAGDIIWTRTLNSSSNNSDVPVNFKRDDSGNLLILFNEQGDNSHINLAKFDTDGNILWHYRLADTVSTGTSMSIDSLNNIYISGYKSSGFNDLACILKINPDGVLKWIRSGETGSQNEILYSDVKVTGNNEIYALGEKRFGFSTIMKIVKIDSAGNTFWQDEIKYNLDGKMNPKELDIDDSGNIYFTGSLIPIVTGNSGGGYYPGYLMGKYDPAGSYIWNRYISNQDIYSGDDIYMRINDQNKINILCYLRNPKRVGMILKFNDDGDSLSSGFFNGETYGSFYSLALNSNGNPIACGSKFKKYNEYDHTVKVYDSDCQTEWESQYDSKGFSNDNAGNVLEDSNGNIYIAGYNNRQAILTKYDAALTEQWKYTISDTSGYDPYYNFIPCIVMDPNDNIYFASSVIRDSTGSDIQISKFDPAGAVLLTFKIASPVNKSTLLRAITTDELGNLYVSGDTDAKFISKYSPSGIKMWTSNFSSFFYYHKIIVKEDMIYFMGDNTIIKFNHTGNQIWGNTYQPNNHVHFFRDFQIDKQNNVIACGTGVFENQSENYIIVKYDIDGNQTWSRIYNGLRNSGDNALSIALDSLNNIYVAGSAGEFATSFQESITLLKLDPEGDQLWKKIISDPNGIRVMPGQVKLDKFNNVYVSSGKGSFRNSAYLIVKYRSNGDSIWSSAYNNPKYTNTSSDFILTDNNDIIMTGNSYGENSSYDITTLKYSQTVGINSNNSAVVNQYKLSQNYPNPFNPKTIIKYDLGVKNFVSLVVYDALGKEVKTLVNSEQPSGSHKVEFNGEGFPSGVYFYKLKSGEFIETKRMVLVK